MTSQTGPQLPIDLHYPDTDVSIDIDAILSRGKARVRRRRLTATGVAVLVVLVAGATATLAHAPRHNGPAIAAAGGNLLAQHPPASHVEVLRSGAGWHPVAYRDRGGRLCEGWLDPVSHGVTGACLDAVATGNGRAAVTRPLLVEPQAGVSGGSVQAFGVAGPATHTLDLAVSGSSSSVQLSTVRSTHGDRAWLTAFPTRHASRRTVHLVAHGRDGNVIATVGFRPPAGGSTPSPITSASAPPATPTASPTDSGTPIPTDGSPSQPTPTQTPDSPVATPPASPAVTDSPLAATTP